MWKRLLCTAILAHASCGVWAASGSTDSYPSKTIRLIDGFSAGGGTDYLARIIGAKMTERTGQTVMVDNRPGAASTIAAEITARANPDGYTLFISMSSLLSSSSSLYLKLGYDPLKDFSYVLQVATGTQVLIAHPSVPAKSVSELVALARSQPKSLRFGSAGVGSPIHLAMELLISRTGMELLHVPYKGGALSVIAVAGGEAQIAFASVPSSLAMIKAQRLNALAVSGTKRMTGTLPGVPTVAESGYPGFIVTDIYGIVAPAGTPAAVVKLLNAEIRKILQMDDVRAKFAEQALEAAGSTPEEWRASVEAEAAQWARIIKDARITVN